jgi:hypothetical protein
MVTQPAPMQPLAVTVNGVVATTKEGKKEGTFQLKETPEMYGARLMQDIVADPTKFFVRKEITRSTDDLVSLFEELKASSQMLRFRQNRGCFEKNENQCENMYRCPYIDICYNHVDVEGGTLPDKYVIEERN